MRMPKMCIYLEIRYCANFFLLPFPLSSLSREPFVDARTLYRVCHSTLFVLFRTHSTAVPLPSYHLSLSRIRTYKRVIYSFSLTQIHTYTRAYSRCVEKQNMRMPRYYVMPTDCGSDILCMLMLHNVGFVPLFSIYLFGSPSHDRFCRERGHDVMFVPGITVSRSVSWSNSWEIALIFKEWGFWVEWKNLSPGNSRVSQERTEITGKRLPRLFFLFKLLNVSSRSLSFVQTCKTVS